MDNAPQADLAVRIWAEPFSVDTVKTQQGKEFRLINLPFYEVGVLPDVLALYLKA